MRPIKPVLKKISYYGKRGALKVIDAVEWLVGWYDPMNSMRMREIDVEACLELENERACDRMIESPGL